MHQGGSHTHVHTGYCSLWASWLIPMERKWSLFEYKWQLSTHTHAHKRIYTHKPSKLLTRTLTQQRGSGVFSFDPTHAILVSHTVSQTASVIHTHTQAQIYTFLHASPSCFFSDTHIHNFPFFTLARINAHRHTHTIVPGRGFKPGLSDLLKNKVALAKPD